MTKLRSMVGAVALLATTGLAGVAAAQGVRVEVPVFTPDADFDLHGGYYRTREGHYYHYDHERHGWHYGRDHREGLRWEERHRR